MERIDWFAALSGCEMANDESGEKTCLRVAGLQATIYAKINFLSSTRANK